VDSLSFFFLTLQPLPRWRVSNLFFFFFFFFFPLENFLPFLLVRAFFFLLLLPFFREITIDRSLSNVLRTGFPLFFLFLELSASLIGILVSYVLNPSGLRRPPSHPIIFSCFLRPGTSVPPISQFRWLAYSSRNRLEHTLFFENLISLGLFRSPPVSFFHPPDRRTYHVLRFPSFFHTDALRPL